MTNITKPQRTFLPLLFATILALRGKVNFLNLSRYSPLDERTFRRHFRRHFDFLSFNLLALATSLPASSKKIVAFDATFIKKSGKKTFGLDSFFNSGVGRCEPGLELSVAALVDLQQNTAYALDALQTPPSSLLPTTASAQEETRVDGYLKHFASLRQRFPETVEYGVFDGYFAKKKFVNGVCSLPLHCISKLRKDANLRYRFTGEQKPRGRKRLYGEKVQLSDLNGFVCLDEADQLHRLYTAVCYSVGLSRWLRVVVVEKRQAKAQPSRAILFSTNLEQEAQEIYEFYKARFQIEFLFRDAKQQTGLSDCQARDEKGLRFHFNASLSTVNLTKIEFQRAKEEEKKSFSMSSVKQRAYNEQFLEMIISKLALEPSLIKNHPEYDSLRNYAVIAA